MEAHKSNFMFQRFTHRARSNRDLNHLCLIFPLFASFLNVFEHIPRILIIHYASTPLNERRSGKAVEFLLHLFDLLKGQ